MLIARRLAFIITLRCTLKCKLCCNCITMYDKHPTIGSDFIASDMNKAFDVYDKIEWLQFVGGEVFLHPNLDDILSTALNYSNQFEKVIIMTNGTLVPSKSVLDVLKQFGDRVEIQISDYGKLSCKINELKEVLTEAGVPHVIKKYHGDIIHYGGWVDSGDFVDYGETDEQIQAKFDNCWQIGMKNLHVYNGQIHNCIRSLFATDLNKQITPISEYIDLRGDLSLEEMKEIAKKFNTKPLTACRMCAGFDSNNSKRYPAAEQV